MSDLFRLGIVFTHPTQHHGPLWRKLSEQPGISLTVLYLCSENQKTGDRLLGTGGQPWDVDLLSGYKYKYLRNLWGRIPSKTGKHLFAPALFSLLTRRRFDAIFMQSFVNYSYRLTALLCKIRGIPLIMQNDATIMSDERYSRMRRIALSVMYPWMLNLADYWLSCGDHNEIHLRHYGVSDRKFVRGCHPVDGDRYESTISQNTERIRSIRERFACDKDRVVFGWAAKYIHRKNPFEFIHAVSEAHRRDPRILGIMLGGGELERAINSRLAAMHGEVLNVGFINQNQLPLYYAALDVFVATSVIDPHPLVVSEAMASGCTVILSDRCGNWGYSDTVIPGYNGLVYPCKNVRALADAMIFMTNRKVRDEFRKRAREVFHKQDLHCEVRAFVKVIEKVRSGRRNQDSAGTDVRDEYV